MPKTNSAKSPKHHLDPSTCTKIPGGLPFETNCTVESFSEIGYRDKAKQSSPSNCRQNCTSPVCNTDTSRRLGSRWIFVRSRNLLELYISKSHYCAPVAHYCEVHSPRRATESKIQPPEANPITGYQPLYHRLTCSLSQVTGYQPLSQRLTYQSLGIVTREVY